MDVFYLEFIKAFDTISLGILLERLTACGLDTYTSKKGKRLSGWPDPGSGGGWS